MFPAFHEKAAIYCSRIVHYHPLVDGNKRTGYAVMREFIARNDRHWRAPDRGADEIVQTIEDLAAATLDEDLFIAWVARRIT